MGRLTLSGFEKRKHRRRLEAETFDPRKAPHRDLVVELVAAHVPSIQQRMRRDLIEEVAMRIIEFEPTPEALAQASASERLMLLVARCQQAVRQLEIDGQFLERRFDEFSALMREAHDQEEQRLLMAEYLSQTVTNARKLRGDLRALKRFLDLDTLRERNEYERQRLAVCIEIGVYFTAVAFDAAMRDPGEGASASLRAMAGEPERFWARVLTGNERWQTRLAASEGLTSLYGYFYHNDLGVLMDAEVLESLASAISSRDEHPWVRVKALECALYINPDRGELLLWECLQEDRDRSDFLLRRLAMELAVARLPARRALAMIDDLIAPPDMSPLVDYEPAGVARRESSEHVRIGIAAALVELPPMEAISRLRRLSGLDGHEEASAKVRAQAVISARQLAVSVSDIAMREAASAIVVDMLASDIDHLPLRVACEELADLARELAEQGEDEQLQSMAPSWIASLMALSRHRRCPPAIAEIAAAAAETIVRESEPERRRATQVLGDLVRSIPLGGSRKVRLSRLPEEVVALCRDPSKVTRVLADLAREDWGIGLAVARRTLRLWRGDHMRRRLWRILHELRNPAPNKRQAFVHTVGRRLRSPLRAHPGRLDEVTATTVPGERLFSEREGSWGRHLPCVDDLLDLPLWRRRSVRIGSSYGLLTIVPPRSFFRRLYARLSISWNYAALSALRHASISAQAAQERGHFLELFHKRYHIDFRLHNYPLSSEVEAAASDGLEPELDIGNDGHVDAVKLNPAAISLFPTHAIEQRSKALSGESAPSREIGHGSALAVGALAIIGSIEELRDWFEANLDYFSSLTQNSQTALALFIGGLSVFFTSQGYIKRRQLERARNRIPLCIGGWGTRGKSGTERLKAGLFHGLGFDVFVKTTGCEAMMMHAPPGQKPVEIFIYRPYDKATIWEQFNLVRLAQHLDPDVFLWECMALNPRYVRLLEHDWMHDDLVTLTNAYPDHEDIQGPAGINVAQVITEFIPHHSTLISSEVNFASLFAEVCRQRDTRYIHVHERVGDLIADDLLDLYPYSEHPRNIALVARMAAELGVDPVLAMVIMAENVVADLGVLKTYPRVRVHGRVVRFINGFSANERAGFLNNWNRTGLAKLDCEESPTDVVITVVNNRADRISRSEVFARILINDVNVDRHVLIGTNLKGLQFYLDRALSAYMARKRIIDSTGTEDAGADGGTDAGERSYQSRKRLQAEMARLRIPTPTPLAMLKRLAVYAGGIGCTVDPNSEAALSEILADLLAPNARAALSLAAVRQELDKHMELKNALDDALVPMRPGRAIEEDPEAQLLSFETVEPATREDLIAHWLRQASLIIVRARLEFSLDEALKAKGKGAADSFQSTFQNSFRELFMDSLLIIENPTATGDQIVSRAALSVPPGTDVRIMGSQNIKGTGLDFVYRWIALDNVVQSLLSLHSERSDRRINALRELEAFGDHGVVDAGLARAVLAVQPVRQPSAEEHHLRERIQNKLSEVHATRLQGIRSQSKRSGLDRVAGVFEGSVDYLDSIRRYHNSRRVLNDLANRRVSHGRAVLEMRALVARQKGGWLAKSLRKWLEKRKS